ncbi:MAG: peptidoglycan DD-metalloendopeptidase family protein [Xanthomonadaceae bacterium]|nr:peptidoglycan DD-metalloendopeptidase family protein [Xanthomonadaceae bacterium]
METRGMETRHWWMLAAACGLLAACGHSRVVRSTTPAHPVARSAAPALPPVRQSQPKYGATAVVRPGQTVYRIATENGITALDLALWNAIPPPYIIHPGQTLRLYPRDGREAAPTPAPTAASVTGTSGKPAPTQAVSAAVPSAAVSLPVASTLAWLWPADGSVVSGFAAGDPTRQGMDIAGKSGQPVRAAADGVVVYSGAGLVGYGELVIIKHNDQWLSAYGHNRARLVNEGALVKGGQQIAEMGRSGATRDMLHFEIRYNGKPVDPQGYLPRR